MTVKILPAYEPVQLTAAKLADELMDVVNELERPACLGYINELSAEKRMGLRLPRTFRIIECQAARLKQLANLLRG